MARRITLLEDPRYDAFVERYHADPLRFAIEVCQMAPSEDQQDLLMEMSAPEARVSVVSGTGCFAAGTQMMRSDGRAVAVEGVRVGDRLMGPDGASVRNVLELKRGREPMYRFTYTDGTSHVFNESHILCLTPGAKYIARGKTDRVNITVREWLKWPKTRQKCHYVYRSPVEHFDRAQEALPVPPYILGLWLGDGTSAKPEISSPDAEVIDAWQAYIRQMRCTVLMRLQSRSEQGVGCYGVSATRVVGTSQANPVTAALRAAGVFENKHIPDAYLYASLEDRRALVAGLIDTDGHYDKSSGGYDWIQKGEHFARQFCWLVRSIGCSATIKECRKGCQTGAVGTYWRVTIGRNIESIPVRIPRKRRPETDPVPRGRLEYGILKVEPLGEGDYFGFVLDGDSRFLGHDFTVLHNTGKSATFARIAVWSLLCHPYGIFDGEVQIGSNTYIGAPLVQQVGDGVWKELQDTKIAICGGPHAWIADYFNITKTRVTVRGYEAQWFIAQVALAKGQSVGVAGKHRFWQLIIIDEAAGVGDDHFDVIDGTQTQGGNRTLMASQGVRSSGRFYDTHHKLSYKSVDKDGRPGAWVSLRFSSENSPFVTNKWLRDRAIETGGRETAEFQIRVLGLFPELTEKFLIGRGPIERLIGAPPTILPDEPWGHMVVIDVAAGVYRDKTVATHFKVIGNGDRLEVEPRRADVVGVPIFSNSLDWQEVAGRVHDYCHLLSNVTLVVDVGGQGEQFARMLENLGMGNVVRVLWGNPPFKKAYKKRFFNQRAQCSVHATEAVKDGRITFTHEHQKELLDQGSRIPYFFDEKARYHIMPKDRMKEEEGLPSPDLWDTVCMAFLEDAHYIVSSDGDGRDHAGARKAAADALAAELEAALAG